MNNDDVLASIGTTLSAIAATISAIYSIPIVSSLFTFIVGAFVTFLVQSRLQDRAEKRKLRVKAIEELHIPLYLKLEKIKEELLLNLEMVNIGTWDPLFDKPQMFTLKTEFKKDLIDFFKQANKLEEQFQGIKGIAIEVINNNFEKQLVPMFKEQNIIDKMTKLIEIEKGNEGIIFCIRLARLYWAFDAPILSLAILNKDPITYLENSHKSFETDKLILVFRIRYMFSDRQLADT